MTENGSIANSGRYSVDDSWYEVPAIQSERVNGDDWSEGWARPCRFATTALSVVATDAITAATCLEHPFVLSFGNARCPGGGYFEDHEAQ